MEEEGCRIPPDLPPGKKYHAFISYNSADEDWVDELIDFLESPQNGFRCVNHLRDFHGGKPVLANINEFMEKSWKYVVVLTPQFVASDWCKFETEVMMHMSVEQKEDNVIPILLKPCRIPKTLKHLTYVEVGSRHDWQHKILNDIRRQGGRGRGNTDVTIDPAVLSAAKFKLKFGNSNDNSIVYANTLKGKSRPLSPAPNTRRPGSPVGNRDRDKKLHQQSKTNSGISRQGSSSQMGNRNSSTVPSKSKTATTNDVPRGKVQFDDLINSRNRFSDGVRSPNRESDRDHSQVPVFHVNGKDRHDSQHQHTHDEFIQQGARPKTKPKAFDQNIEFQKTQNAATENDDTFEKEKEICPNCLDEIHDRKVLSRCGHAFCRECIDDSFSSYKPVCPILTGNMPQGNMDVGFSNSCLPGYESYGIITITYHYPNGIQGANHPNPGQFYKGTTRVAYLPANKEGKKVLKLLQVAFERKLTFTIGRSTTTGRENVVTWNDIHHKTNMEGGPTNFGYPDPGYFSRVKEELASKGVTEKNIFSSYKPVCPSCNMVYGILTGDQPQGNMDVGFSNSCLPGYESYGIITITYHYPNGIQGANHPNPGQFYKGTTRVAYLPANKEGKRVLKLLQVAFERKLTFTIGRSTTTGRENVVTWNDIHHKTNMEGGPTNFGYPDPGYFSRVKEELASKGVTEKNIFSSYKPVCPSCNMVYGILTGDQPQGNMDVGFSNSCLPGYESYGIITITYHYPNGIQGANHPNPGQFYKGTTRVAYLPDNKEGRKVLKLLQVAFERKLTFTIGRSTTTGRENVVTWNDIHHKINMEGGPTNFGYPDPGYLSRVKEELASKGVTEENI